MLHAQPNPSRTHLHAWLRSHASQIPAGTRVLDAGAGGAPYRALFKHCDYKTADFGQIDKRYAHIDYVCDLTRIPVNDGAFDLVICTQVFEHIPEPAAVLMELQRVLRPGGVALVTAPLFYEEHEAPYDFYRYTRYAWERLASLSGFAMEEIAWLEGYYGTLAYQLFMAASTLPRGFLPLRLLFHVLGQLFAVLDVAYPNREIGMCKNYRLVLTKSSSSPGQAPGRAAPV